MIGPPSLAPHRRPAVATASQPRRFVLTGAPGSGKTTLLHLLAERGRYVVEEAATDVIAAEQATGCATPWDTPGFINKVVALQRRRQLRPVEVDVQLYDRSPLCTLALARYLGVRVPTSVHREVDRVVRDHVYENEMFLIRPLGFVERTAARQIGYEASLEFEAVHVDVSREHGYVLLDIPRGTVTERARAVTDRTGRR